MELMYRFLLFSLCVQISVCGEINYRAAVVRGNYMNRLNDYLPQISEAKAKNVDIVLLFSQNVFSEVCSDLSCGPDNYDVLLRDISSTAKFNKVYIVTSLYETLSCEDSDEIYRANMAFDRNGNVVSVYKKPINNMAACNTTTDKMASFSTDFGIDFQLLMSDDMIQGVTRNSDNIIITGGSNAAMAYLKENHLIGSWAYIEKATVISDHGIFIGKSGLQTTEGLVYDINVNGKDNSNEIYLGSNQLPYLEDLNQYELITIDLERSREGYAQTLCQDKVCCEFYVKTTSKDAENYAFAVFNGVRKFGESLLETESCKLIACTTNDRKACMEGLDNNIIVFEKILITGNFTNDHYRHFPVILTTETSISNDRFRFGSRSVKNVQQITIELSNSKNIYDFGILGLDYSKDYNNFNSNSTDSKTVNNDFYDFILHEDVVEFFDCLWIKLRIIVLIVSVYILEMM